MFRIALKMAEAEKNYKKNVETKLKLAENKNCADCDANNPRWASCKYGIFICLECAGTHRALGINYDYIKSATLDQWNKEHWYVIKYGGNEKFKNYLKECGLRLDKHSITEIYTNSKMLKYSEMLMKEIKEKTGVDLPPAAKENNSYEETMVSNRSPKVTNFSTEAPSVQTLYGTSSYRSSKPISYKNNNASLEKIKNVGMNIKNKIAQYSPSLASISATTCQKIGSVSSTIYSQTKKIGSKTITSAQKLVTNTKNSITSGNSSFSNKKGDLDKNQFTPVIRKNNTSDKDWS